MLLIDLVIGFFVAGVLLWSTNRSRAHSRRANELAKENYRLRYVVAELSMDKHSLNGSFSGRW